MASREYEGKIIRKELTNRRNYRLIIRLNNNNKIIFCYTKRFVELQQLQEEKEYYFFDSQKNGGKYFFLDRANLKEEKEKIIEHWQQEIKEYQINSLIEKYKIINLAQIEKELTF